MRLESKGKRRHAEDSSHGSTNILGGTATGVVGATTDTRRDTASGLDSTIEEVLTARILDTLVEVRLAAHEGRVGETGRVRAIALERDVRHEDAGRAGRAELRAGHVGLQEEVDEVRLGERGHVGDERGGRVVAAAQRGVHIEVVLEVRLAVAGEGDVDVEAGRTRGHLGGTVAAAVRLGADSLAKRSKDVEAVVGEEDTGVGSRGELGFTGSVEGAELAANQAVGAG